MTPEQKRLYEEIQAKASAPVSREFWVDETVWNSAAPYKVSRPKPEWGININFDIESNSISSQKVTSMAQPPAKKYRASIMVETNDLDRGTVTVQRLLSVDLAADSFADLVAQAHGHLELAKDN